MSHSSKERKEKKKREGLPSLSAAAVVCLFLCLPAATQSVALGAGVGSASPGLGEEYDAGLSVITAQLNATYRKKDVWNSELDESCHFCSWSRVEAESGKLVAISASFCISQGSLGVNLTPSPYEKWIALFDGGIPPCRDLLYRVLTTWSSHAPSHIVSMVKNASGIMIYNADFGDVFPQTSSQKHKDDPVAIMITKNRGEHLSSLLSNGTRVDVRISVGVPKMRFFGSTINKTSMLFLSISFVVLMVISLAWLVFYYVQRSRYTHAKQRLSKRLMRAAKKAIGKMPLKTIYSKEDVETECDVCAICIEGYKTSEVVRILPCHHIFHKPCIDPWLVEQRSCPICKIDILKAFGMQVTKGHHQLHQNNPLDADPASSSLMELPPLSGSLVGHESTVSAAAQREFDSDGVEIVRFHQVAQVEHHHPSASWSSSGGEEMPSSSAGGNPSPTAKSISPAVVLVAGACKTATVGCVHQRGGSSDSNSSGSVVIDEEVFHRFHHPQHHHYQHLQPRQALSQKPSGGGSSSVSAGSSSSSDNAAGGDAVGCGRQQLGKKESSASSSRASAEYLDAISDPSKHHAQELPAAAVPSRLPFLQSAAAGDRALASASELQPLSERAAAGEDCGARRVSGVLFSKFPMETGL